jgi:hypothetical protein
MPTWWIAWMKCRFASIGKYAIVEMTEGDKIPGEEPGIQRWCLTAQAEQVAKQELRWKASK